MNDRIFVRDGVFYRETSSGRSYGYIYTDSLGRRRTKMIRGDMMDAVRAKARLEDRKYRGEEVTPSKMTLSELLDEYMEIETAHLRPSTKKTYEGSVEVILKPRLGHIKVMALKRKHIVQFVTWMRTEDQTRKHTAPYSSWYIHGTLSPLSKALDYAVLEGMLAVNPVKQLTKQQRPNGFARGMRILSTEEISAVLRKAPEHYRPLLETAIFTGLRVGELMALKWSDVDFEESVLTVHHSKTEAGKRDVVIPPFLLQRLAGMTEEAETVFTNEKGRPIAHRNQCRYALQRALEGAKITDRVRFHDLRHTFASILIGQGEDVTYVADQMGHANPSITLKVYAKLFDPKVRRQEARKRMEEKFAGVAA